MTGRTRASGTRGTRGPRTNNKAERNIAFQNLYKQRVPLAANYPAIRYLLSYTLTDIFKEKAENNPRQDGGGAQF